MSKVKVAASITIVAVLVTAGLGAAVTLAGRYQQLKADRILRDVYQIKLGSATYQSVRDLTTRHGGHSVGACSREKCRFDIVVSNRIYYRLGLARPKEFGVTLFVKDDRVIRISFGVICSPLNADQYPLGYGVSVVDESCYPCYEGQVPFLAKPNGVDAAHPQQIIVQLTGASTLAQRRAAYALDLRCLSEFGDCPRLDKVAPVIWREIDRRSGE